MGKVASGLLDQHFTRTKTITNDFFFFFFLVLFPPAFPSLPYPPPPLPVDLFDIGSLSLLQFSHWSFKFLLVNALLPSALSPLIPLLFVGSGFWIVPLVDWLLFIDLQMTRSVG